MSADGSADGGLFGSTRAARGYARDRPPVHRPVVERILATLGLEDPVELALDVGCGAGASTAALAPHARRTVGVDPSNPMVLAAGRVAGAWLLRGEAAALPVRASSIDLVTAAGSLDFAPDLVAVLGELRRVLAPGGTVAVYDFSAGRRIPGDERLERWYVELEARWPREPPPSTVTAQTLAAGPLRVVAEEQLTVALRLDHLAYLAYVMTESNVRRAVQRGESEAAVERWCAETLAPIFPTARTVELDAWFTLLVAG